MTLRNPALLCATLAVLAGCGRGDATMAAKPAEDPMIALALAAPLMVDPDLAARNRGDDAIVGGGPAQMDMPAFLKDEAAVAAVMAEAERLAGGPIAAAPAPEPGPEPLLAAGIAPLSRARAIGGPGTGCAAGGDYAMAWSLRLPPAFAIYPRANLLDAAGSDRSGCALRAVRFVTPVEPAAVLDYYHARASAARFQLRRSEERGLQRLAGTRTGGAFAIEVRKRDDGLSEVDLIVNGG